MQQSVTPFANSRACLLDDFQRLAHHCSEKWDSRVRENDGSTFSGVVVASLIRREKTAAFCPGLLRSYNSSSAGAGGGALTLVGAPQPGGWSSLLVKSSIGDQVCPQVCP